MQLAWVVPPVSRRVRLKNSKYLDAGIFQKPQELAALGAFVLGFFSQLDIFVGSLLRSAPFYPRVPNLVKCIFTHLTLSCSKVQQITQFC